MAQQKNLAALVSSEEFAKMCNRSQSKLAKGHSFSEQKKTEIERIRISTRDLDGGICGICGIPVR